MKTISMRAALALVAAFALTFAASCAVSADQAFEAAKAGDLKTIERYLSGNGDANAIDGMKNTLAHVAAYNRQSAVLKALAESGADLGKGNGAGLSPLDIAATVNDVESARVLLDAGADPDRRNALDRKKAAIHYAAINAGTGVAALLLDRGVDIDARCGIGATPVTWAAYASTLESVKLFVERGADLSVVDSYGDTALSSAKESGRDDIYRYLLEKGVAR